MGIADDNGEASKRGDAAGVIDEQRWIRFISTTKVVETGRICSESLQCCEYLKTRQGYS